MTSNPPFHAGVSLRNICFGTGTSAFQSGTFREFAQSNWSEDAHRHGNIPFTTTTRSYKDNIEETLDQIQRMGMTLYRTSVEWSFIEPHPGEFDPTAIQFYRRLAQECLSRNIQLMLTLHHFTHPQWFTEQGDFTKETNIHYFVNYCTYVFNHLSSLVPLWCTINEPAIFAFSGYFYGQFPPHQPGNLKTMAMVLKHLLKAHLEVYRTLKALPNGNTVQIGVTHNTLRFIPNKHFAPITSIIAKQLTRITHDLVINFFKTGEFSYKYGFFTGTINYSDPEKNLPRSDFWGFNGYGRCFLGFNIRNGYGPTTRLGMPMGDFNLPKDPEGIALGIQEAAELNLPIYITETGIADHSDKLRQEFLIEVLLVTVNAIARGIPILGFIHWTHWDNYEWDQGNTIKFGLFKSDGTPRPSAYLYEQILKKLDHIVNNNLSSELEKLNQMQDLLSKALIMVKKNDPGLYVPTHGAIGEYTFPR
jgi:beta-glucosidase